MHETSPKSMFSLPVILVSGKMRKIGNSSQLRFVKLFDLCMAAVASTISMCCCYG